MVRVVIGISRHGLGVALAAGEALGLALGVENWMVVDEPSLELDELLEELLDELLLP